VHGRADEGATDYADANWLRVTANCSTNGANVWAEGAILQVMDVQKFGEECARVFRGELHGVRFYSHEPQLRIWVHRTDKLGHLRARIWLTAEHDNQFHAMDFEIDQSHLPDIIGGCERIVRELPVRGSAPASPVAGQEGSKPHGRVLYPKAVTVADVPLVWVIGRSVTLSFHEPSWWHVALGDDLGVGLECPWRLISEGRICVSDSDHGQWYGLAEPVDAVTKSNKLLAGKAVQRAMIRPETNDLVLEVDGDLRLEILPFSMGYESWHIHAPGGREFVAQGGGRISEYGGPA
jgi:hypothetical protein